MKLRVLSIGRKVAIALCAVLALVTGITSVLLPRLSGISAAAAYDSLSVSSTLTALEQGLDKIADEHKPYVYNQLKQYLMVQGKTGDALSGKLDDDAYTVERVTYSEGKAIITVKGTGENASAEGTYTINSTVEATFGSVVVEVNTDKAVQATWKDNASETNGGHWEEASDGTWKILNGTTITDESVFLTSRPIFVDGNDADIESFLIISLQYQTVKVPVHALGDDIPDTQTLNLGDVNSYRIRQKAFAEGKRNIDVSVAIPFKGLGSFTRVGSLNVEFESPKVVHLTVTPSGNSNLTSYSDISEAITVMGYYNNGEPPKELKKGEYTTDSTLVVDTRAAVTSHEPLYTDSQAGLSGTTVDRSTISNSYTSTALDSNTATGHGIPGNLYAGSDNDNLTITVSCGEATGSAQVWVKQANPYQIIGISGIPTAHKVGDTFNLDGMSVILTYASEFKDLIQQGNNVSSVASTTVTAKTVTVPLKAVRNNVTISFDGGNTFQPINTATFTKAGLQPVKLRYEYQGQMFYFATGVVFYDNTLIWNQHYCTRWQHNPNYAEDIFSVNVAANDEVKDVNYFDKPVIDQNDVGYSKDLTKTITGIDLSNPTAGNRIEDGTTIEISNGFKSLKFEYIYVTNNGVTSIVPRPDSWNNSDEVGISFTPETGIMNINRPGSYTVTVTMPKKGQNDHYNCWRGEVVPAEPETSTDTKWYIASYDFVVEKGDLGVIYSNVSPTTSGYQVRMNEVHSALSELDALFSTGASLVFENVPTTYEIKIRYVGNTIENTQNTDKTWHTLRSVVDGVATVNNTFINDTSETVGDVYELCITYADTTFYNGKEISPATIVKLNVVNPNVSDISEVFTYDRSKTAEWLRQKWQNAVDETYTVSVQKLNKETNAWEAASGVLHVTKLNEADSKGESYRIVFERAGSDPVYVPVTVAQKRYSSEKAEYKNDSNTNKYVYPENLDFNDLTAKLTDTANAYIADKGIYYEIDTLQGFTNNEGVTIGWQNVTNLPVGVWRAAFTTKTATKNDEKHINDYDNDYDHPLFYVEFELVAVDLNSIVDSKNITTALSPQAQSDTVKANTYSGIYNNKGYSFTLNTWNQAAFKNIGVTYEGRLFVEYNDGSTNTNLIPNNFYTVSVTDTFTINVTHAGTYTITLRKSNDNVIFTETTFTLIVTQIKTQIEQTGINIERVMGALQLPANITFKDQVNATGEMLRIGTYTLYKEKDADNNVVESSKISFKTEIGYYTGADLPENVNTLYLVVDTLTADNVRSSDGRYQALFTYAANYEYTSTVITVTLAQGKLPVLSPMDTSDNAPLQPTGTEKEYTFTADYGQAIDILSYFLNVSSKKENYMIAVRDLNSTYALRDAMETANAEKLLAGQLDAGQYVIEITPHSDYTWDDTNKTTDPIVIKLTINKTTVEVPTFTVASTTFTGEVQTHPLGGTSVYWQSLFGTVKIDESTTVNLLTATVYWFDTTTNTSADNFDPKTGTTGKGTFEIKNNNGVYSGVLSYTDAGIYYIAFTLNGNNHVWSGVTGDTPTAQHVVTNARKQIQLPDIKRAYDITDSDGNITFDAIPNYTVEGFVIDYGTAKGEVGANNVGTVTFTLNGATKGGNTFDASNFVWARNNDDVDGLQYVDYYATGAQENPEIAILNYIKVQSKLDIQFVTTASMFYGGYAVDNHALIGSDDFKTLFKATGGADMGKLEGENVSIAYTYNNGSAYVPFTATILQGLTVGHYVVNVDITVGEYTPMTFAVALDVQKRPVNVTVAGELVYGEELNLTKENSLVLSTSVGTLSIDEQTTLKQWLVDKISFGGGVTNTKYNVDETPSGAWLYAINQLHANYEFVIDSSSNLTVSQATAQVTVNVTAPYGSTPDEIKASTNVTLTFTHNGNTVDLDVDTSHLVFDVRAKADNNGYVATYVSGLSHTNYQIEAAEESKDVFWSKLDVQVEIGNLNANFGVANAPAVNTIDIIKVPDTLSAALQQELKDAIAATLTSNAIVGGATAPVGIYDITSDVTAFTHFNVTYTFGKYTVNFNIDDERYGLKFDVTPNLTYNSSAKTLVTAKENAALEGVSYTIYYHCSRTEINPAPQEVGNLAWEPLAREANAGDYYIYYYIRIAGFDAPIFGTTHITDATSGVLPSIAAGENGLTPLMFDSEEATNESNPVIGWMYGQLTKSVVAPTATYGGTVSYELFDKDGTEPLRVQFNDNFVSCLNDIARTLKAGMYRLEATTTGAANYKNHTEKFYFTVEKATLTFTAQSKTVEYGIASDIAANGFTVSGNNGLVDKAAILSALSEKGYTVKQTTNYTKGAPVKAAGEDPYYVKVAIYNDEDNEVTDEEVLASLLDNYAILLATDTETGSFVNGTITVTKRQITIRIKSTSVGYGATQNDMATVFPRNSILDVTGEVYKVGDVQSIFDIVQFNLNNYTLNYVKGDIEGGDNDYLVLADTSFNNADKTLRLEPGKYPIYGSWKDNSFATNYDITLVGDYTEAYQIASIAEGKAYTAGTFTVNALQVNVVWDNNNRAFVYNGTAISLNAQATQYRGSDGEMHNLANARTLVISYCEYDPNSKQDIPNTLVTNGTLPINVGTYKIFAELNDDDKRHYTTGGSYIIVKIEAATLNVSLGNATLVYGNELSAAEFVDKDNPITFKGAGENKVVENELGAIKTAFENVTFEKGGFAVLGHESDPINKLGVGQYLLTLSASIERTGVLRNYNIVPTYGTLTITQRHVTVTNIKNVLSVEYTGSEISSNDLDKVEFDLKDGDDPNNGETMDADTLDINFVLPRKAVNVGVYGVSLTATNFGNYFVTFASGATTHQLQVTPKHITITTVINVVYGNTTADYSYIMNGATASAEDDARLVAQLRNQQVAIDQGTTQTVLISGAPQYNLELEYNSELKKYTYKGLTEGSDITLAPDAGDNFVFLNYKVIENGYKYRLVVHARTITATPNASEFTYIGSAIEPTFTFDKHDNGVLSDDVAPQITYKGDKITNGEAINAGHYTAELTLDATRYTFAEGTSKAFNFEVKPQIINLGWANTSILYDSSSTQQQINALLTSEEGYSNFADIEALENNDVLAIALKKYTYSYDSEGNPIDSEEGAGTFSLYVSGSSYGAILSGVGVYSIEITLNDQVDAAGNYAFGGGIQPGENANVRQFTFSAYSNSATLDIVLGTGEGNEKVYDGNAIEEDIKINGTSFVPDESGKFEWTRFLVKTYAKITPEDADVLKGQNITSTLLAQNGITLSYTADAPVNAGYYILHAVYFRETSQGGEGAESYVLYRIAPQVIHNAPAWVNASTVVYNGETREFIVSFGEENLAGKEAFAYAVAHDVENWIWVTKRVNVGTTDAPVYENQKVSAAISVDQSGNLVIGLENVGVYTLHLHIGNDNYIWEKEGSETITDPDGTETTVSTGVHLEGGNVVLNFEITVFDLSNVVLTSEEASATFGDNYDKAVRDNLIARNLPSFIDLSNTFVAYYAWRADGGYIHDDPLSGGIANAGRYYYAVQITGTENYNGGWLNGYIEVEKKVVKVTVNAFMTYGGDVRFNVNSFDFNGFVGKDSAQSLLNIDYAAVRGIYNTEKYPSALLNVDDYPDYLLGLTMGQNGLFAGFSLRNAKIDNYIYEFEANGSMLTVQPYEITVTIGNASTPFGAPVQFDNVTLTTGNRMPVEYDSLKKLLNVSFRLSVGTIGDEAIHAGTYVITATGRNPNYSVTFISGVYTVTPIAVSIEVTPGGGTYSGTADTIREPVLARATSAESPTLNRGTIQDYLEYHYTGTTNGGREIDLYNTVPTEAGNYTVTVEINPRRTGDFTLIGSVSFVFTVEKMSIDVNALQLENDLVYTGSRLYPVIANSQYTGYFTDITTEAFLNAGSYYLVLSIPESMRSNVRWSVSPSEYEYQFAFTVAKAENPITNIRIENWMYGDTANAPTADQLHSDGAQMTFEYFVDGIWTNSVPTNAGTYQVHAIAAESRNYLAFTSLAQTFEIAKKVLAVPSLRIITEGPDKNDTFTGSILTANVLGYDASSMRIDFSTRPNIDGNSVTLTAQDAGTYRISIILLNASNYAWENEDSDGDGIVTLYWTVKPQTIAQTPTESNEQYIVDGSILQYLPTDFDSSIMGIKNNEIGHSGQFEVVVYLLDKANYTWADGSTGDLTFTWTVEGISNVYIGILGGLGGAVLVTVIALVAQVGVHKSRKKREAADMENRENGDADNVGEGE